MWFLPNIGTEGPESITDKFPPDAITQRESSQQTAQAIPLGTRHHSLYDLMLFVQLNVEKMLQEKLSIKQLLHCELRSLDVC